ncbi:MAG: helicase [Clostridia bacterium]|nr:helicase [Clostridia bacterium]
MIRTDITIAPIPKDRLFTLLKENRIRINEYAKRFLAHPRVCDDSFSGRVRIVIAPLSELGFPEGATLPEILAHVPVRGFRLCRPEIGLYLRLCWNGQAQSASSVLTGQHRSPDGAVTVLSEPLEPDDAFPKGLYLRNVDGTLWLRGYVCDSTYRWSENDLFAVEDV